MLFFGCSSIMWGGCRWSIARIRRMVGYLNRSSVLNAWTRQFEHDNLRETGWLRRYFPGKSGGSVIGGGTLIGKILALDEMKLTVAVAGEPEARTMEFEMHESLRGISVGDQVRIQYHAENDHAFLDRVEELRVH